MRRLKLPVDMQIALMQRTNVQTTNNDDSNRSKRLKKPSATKAGTYDRY